MRHQASTEEETMVAKDDLWWPKGHTLFEVRKLETFAILQTLL